MELARLSDDEKSSSELIAKLVHKKDIQDKELERSMDFSVKNTDLNKQMKEAITEMIASTEKSDSSPMEISSMTSAPSTSQNDHFDSVKNKTDELREENERLKLILSQMVENYHSLQRKIDIIQAKNQVNQSLNHDEHEFVTLSLGASRGPRKTMDDKPVVDPSKNIKAFDDLTLGLDYKSEKSSKSSLVSGLGPTHSFKESKEGPIEESPPCGELPKNTKHTEDDEASEQPPTKKTRVSVRVQCDTPTMNDGCHWRKYGQKIAKGNPCPRAYYRCTMSPNCPVRKQVQRCPEDMSILITTYEGTHNHPLPISATTIASTTSAAATMLLSGPSSSASSSTKSSFYDANDALRNLNFSLSNNINISGSKTPPQFRILDPTNPTITLDLTSTTPIQSSGNVTQFPVHFTTATSTNSGSSYYKDHNRGDINNMLQLYSNSSHPLEYRNSRVPVIASTNATASTSVANQLALNETVIRALTTDPEFKSVVATALTTYVGGQQFTSSGIRPTAATTFAVSGNGGERAVSYNFGSSSIYGSFNYNDDEQQGSLVFRPTSKSGACAVSPRDRKTDVNDT